MGECGKAKRYVIDFEGGSGRRRFVAAMIAARRGYALRQALPDRTVIDTDPEELTEQIAQQVADTPDYLLPDTPLMEAIFRVILAGGNQPKTAEEISQVLSTRWAMSAYPRDLSPRVIGRLLDHCRSYCIVPLPEPDNQDDERPS